MADYKVIADTQVAGPEFFRAFEYSNVLGSARYVACESIRLGAHSVQIVEIATLTKPEVETLATIKRLAVNAAGRGRRTDHYWFPSDPYPVARLKKLAAKGVINFDTTRSLVNLTAKGKDAV